MRPHQIAASLLVLSLSLYASAQLKGFSKDEQPPTVAQKLKELHIGLSEEELVSALRNPDGEVRGLAAAQLAAIQAQDEVPSMIDAMERETQPLAKVEIARALALLGSDKGRGVLRANCNSPAQPWFMRTEAARYLLDVGDSDDTCFHALINMLEFDKEWDAKLQALSLLPRFKDVSETDAIKVRGLCVRHLQDARPAVRIAASQALVAFHDESTIPALQQAVAAEPEGYVREQLKVALRQLEKNNQP